MILFVSGRCDIPAFYSRWFFNRLQEGFVDVRNPFNPHQISRIYLNEQNIDGILPEADFNFKNKHILLVEDNELNSEIATEILTEYGFIVDTAENGAEALEKVSTSKPVLTIWC